MSTRRLPMILPAAMVPAAADLGSYAPMSNTRPFRATRPASTNSTTRRGWWLRFAAVSIVPALVSVSAAVGMPGGAVGAANPPVDAPPVSLVGDSTMAGMLWNASGANDPRDIVGNSYRLTFDAESCRRIIAASCRGRFGTVPVSVLPLMRTTLKGRLGEAMVVMAGYDDASITTAVDQVMAEAEAQGVVRVMWLTYRTGTSYILPGGLAASTLYTGHNSDLAAAAQRHSDSADPGLGQVHAEPGQLVRRRRHPPHPRRCDWSGHVHQERARRPAGDRAMPVDVGTDRCARRRDVVGRGSFDDRIGLRAPRAKARSRHSRPGIGWIEPESWEPVAPYRSTSALSCRAMQSPRCSA